MRPRLYPRRTIARAGLFLLTAAISLTAQETAVLSNTGQPMRVAYSCAEDDLQFAGMSCNEDEPCAIYLELSSVVPNGKKIFIAGNLHSNSATLSSILLESDDSGATWKEPAARLRGTAIDQLQFYSLENGWAAGETQYPLPRDPFFLMTTDGGTSWRQQLVDEDGSPGSVQRFWFDSAQHGELIIDAGKASPAGRYLSYESETGGASWMLRAKSDQIPRLRHAPASADNADWRLRPSKDGKAFQVEQRGEVEQRGQVEQRVSEQWTPAASFLIDIASCRIRPGELKEPEAPTEPAAPTALPTPDPKLKRKK